MSAIPLLRSPLPPPAESKHCLQVAPATQRGWSRRREAHDSASTSPDEVADLSSGTQRLWIAIQPGQSFGNPNPYNLSERVWQYTSKLYSSTPPICIAVLSLLLSVEEWETPQYASHLYSSTPPFVRQYFRHTKLRLNRRDGMSRELPPD